MKLNLVKANINTIPDVPRAILGFLNEPFIFARYKDTVYMKEDLTDADRIVSAIEAMWENTVVEPSEDNTMAIDKAYDTVVELQGKTAAKQIDRIRCDMAKEYREKEATIEATAWIERVYENLTEEQADALWDGGYRTRIAEDGMWRAMVQIHKQDKSRYRNWSSASADAAGVYGFLLGMEYGKKISIKEPGAMSDREKLIAEIIEGLNDLDEKSLEVVREYVLLPFIEK